MLIAVKNKFILLFFYNFRHTFVPCAFSATVIAALSEAIAGITEKVTLTPGFLDTSAN